jgi:hypothetical protein
MHDPASELRRIILLRTRVNKGSTKERSSFYNSNLTTVQSIAKRARALSYAPG